MMVLAEIYIAFDFPDSAKGRRADQSAHDTPGADPRKIGRKSTIIDNTHSLISVLFDSASEIIDSIWCGLLNMIS
jgi:hypothetical protein